ncbi:hypothetical protein CHS0354_031399 [Potamilus streckersoni]|uniref:Uncharacterized protein n=1 Tax=Potamilus streckersoni TaxID=2493646 RepID=A0AAE0SK35_9BIVA|nr:hypothetical protein CHS0354_031399 [Potamilus streckersoni]
MTIENTKKEGKIAQTIPAPQELKTTPIIRRSVSAILPLLTHQVNTSPVSTPAVAALIPSTAALLKSIRGKMAESKPINSGKITTTETSTTMTSESTNKQPITPTTDANLTKTPSTVNNSKQLPRKTQKKQNSKQEANRLKMDTVPPHQIKVNSYGTA